MAQLRWIRIAIAAILLWAVLAAGTYFYVQAQNNPINNTDIDLSVPGCIVKFNPDGSYDVVPFGDARCPQ